MGTIQIFPDDRYFELTFLTLQESSYISLSPNQTFLTEFTQLFEHRLDQEKGQRIIEPIQQCSSGFLIKLQQFVSEKGSASPELHKIEQFFRKLIPDSLFLIVFGKLADTSACFNYYHYLRNLYLQRGLTIPRASVELNFGSIFTIYNLHLFGHQRRVIGVGDKAKRICRFCNCKQGAVNHFGEFVSFKSKAHAYSEALGNKLVVLAEECDACNDRFSRTIEPSVVTYFSVFRSLYGLNGKRGIKTLRGENFEMSSDGEIVDISYDGEIELPKTDELPLQTPIRLNLRDKFVPQDVYRSLCKFILSVVPRVQLQHFEQTVKWLNGEFQAELLPPIAILQENNFLKSDPILCYYQRKIKDYRFPYLVGEFHYAHLAMVFIVPFSAKDPNDFTNDVNYDIFWQEFNQSRKDQNWMFQDFSYTDPKEIVIDFSITDGTRSED